MDTSYKQLQIMGHLKALALLCKGLSKGLASNFVWASSKAVHCFAVVFPPPYFNIVSLRRHEQAHQTQELEIHAPIMLQYWAEDANCPSYLYEIMRFLIPIWDFEIVTTTSFEAFNFKMISRTQRSYALIFFRSVYYIPLCANISSNTL